VLRVTGLKKGTGVGTGGDRHQVKKVKEELRVFIPGYR